MCYTRSHQSSIIWEILAQDLLNTFLVIMLLSDMMFNSRINSILNQLIVGSIIVTHMKSRLLPQTPFLAYEKIHSVYNVLLGTTVYSFVASLELSILDTWGLTSLE